MLIKAGAVDPLFSLVMEAVNVLRPGNELPIWATDALAAHGRPCAVGVGA